MDSNIYKLILPNLIGFGMTSFNSILFNKLAKSISKSNLNVSEDDLKKMIIVTSASITFSNLIEYVKFKNK